MIPENAYYLENNGQSAGPYPLSQIQEFLASKTIRPDHPAYLEGTDVEWKPLSSFSEIANSLNRTSRSASVESYDTPNNEEDIESPISRYFDSIMVKCCEFIGPIGDGSQATYARQARFCYLVGNWSCLGAGVILLALGLLGSIKTNESSYLMVGVGCFVVSILIHYVNVKLTNSNFKLQIRSTHVDIVSYSLPQAYAAFLFILGIGVLLAAVVVALASGQEFTGTVKTVLVALVGFGGSLYSTWICLNSEHVLKVKVGLTREIAPGENILSVLIFWMRTWFFSSPLFYGLGTVMGCLLLLVSGANYIFTIDSDGRLLSSMKGGFALVTLVSALAFMLTPILSYFSYCLTSLLADLCQAIFKISTNTSIRTGHE